MPTCPYCAERIDARYATCPYCDADLREPVRAPSYSGAESAGMRMLLPVGRSGWAIAAGYFGLISVMMFPAPIAVVLSIVAFSHLKKNPKLHGMGRAVFGLVMGLLGTAALALFIVVMQMK